jgi:hypothetical protein
VRLLAERVTATWLKGQQADLSAAVEGQSTKQAEFAQGRLNRARRCHLAALAAVAGVRRPLPGEWAAGSAVEALTVTCEILEPTPTLHAARVAADSPMTVVDPIRRAFGVLS